VVHGAGDEIRHLPRPPPLEGKELAAKARAPMGGARITRSCSRRLTHGSRSPKQLSITWGGVGAAIFSSAGWLAMAQVCRRSNYSAGVENAVASWVVTSLVLTKRPFSSDGGLPP